MDFLARSDCEALRAAQRVSEAWMAEVRECRRRRFRRPLAARASDVEYNRVRGDIRVTATRRRRGAKTRQGNGGRLSLKRGDEGKERNGVCRLRSPSNDPRSRYVLVVAGPPS